MKARQLKMIAFMAAVAAIGSTAMAASLKIGDPAPKLETGKWIQGGPVKQFEPGKAYIVEFWATWCGPCKVSIPHLNDTYKQFKDKGLVVVGMDCWERDDTLVAPFVEKMGEKMTYCVALDDKTETKSGRMAETWMAAAGRNGIPSAFLVDMKGIIAWIGHPMELKEQVIQAVLAGEYDIKKAAVEFEQEEKDRGKTQSASIALSRAMQKQDWDTAMTKLEDLEKLLPEEQRGNLDRSRLNILFGKGDYDAAYKLAAKMSESHKNEAMLQNDLAWQIATDKNITQRDLKLAETIATRANDAAKGEDPAILDTLARVKFMRGQKEEAIALQEKAVKLAPSDQQGQYEKVLDSYKKGELAEVE
jgi:thiol-disulfide isomerase/thioredoxin